jgi:D-3-phosphoglycerate dehydrogenase / 2-oxoglutarate reductase
VVDGGISKVEIEYEGHASELNTKLVTNNILKGLLENIVDNVNIINAPVIAHERNIKVAETKHERECDYSTLVTLNISVGAEKTIFKGTLFKNEPRIVQVGDINLEAGLNGNMLFVENEDKPGLVGNLGKLLGDEKINIANFHLGRSKAKKGHAASLVEVDGSISKAVLEKIAKLPSVTKVRAFKF